MNLLDVKVGFTETDAPNVHVGQAATITLDALPNQTFTGHVIELDTNSTLVSNVVTYYAKVAFDTPPAAVKPGMTASVNVVLQKVDDAITLPTSAVSTTGTSETVTVKAKGGPETSRVITVGLRGDNAVQITSGLSVGDQVVETSTASTAGGGSVLPRFGGGGGLRWRVGWRSRRWWRRWPPGRMTAVVAPHPVIAVRDITKVYGEGETEVRALRGVSLDIGIGEYVAIMGASGSGKSTLMHILGCLDVPTSGRYLLDGLDVSKLDDFALSVVRNRKIGFVFQSFNLIPRTSAFANVELPMVYGNVAKDERRARAVSALEKVGLGNRGDAFPNQLSGGQQQRVAIARALATDPAMILADEPTGALDSASTGEVLELFEGLNAEGRTVVVITHEPDVAARAQRLIRLRDGVVIEDTEHASVVAGFGATQGAVR